MRYSIFYLTKYGFSVSYAKRLANHNISMFDIYINSKKTYELQNEVKKSYLSAKRFVVENKIIFNKNTIDSIFNLVYFDISIVNINKLYDMGIDTLQNFYNTANSDRYDEIKKIISKKDINKVLDFCNNFNDSEEKLELEVCEWILNNNENNGYSLFEYLKDKFNYEEVFNFIVKLLSEKILKIEGDNLLLRKLSIIDILNMDIYDLDIVKLKISGLTLEEIGKKYNLTRERVRQRINKFFENFDDLLEDKYRNIFETYRLTREEFKILFSNTDAYEYLNVRYKMGEKSIIDIFKEMEFDKNIKHKIFKLNSMMEIEESHIVPINYANIFSCFMYRNQGKYFTVEQIEDMFIEFVKEYVDVSRAEEISLRGIVDRSEKIIRTHNSRFRYYEGLTDVENIKLINSIIKYEDGVYGVQKIYEDNIEIMEELDLNDGYEFADLCNKYLSKTNLDSIVKVVRRSEIYFGISDKKEFLVSVLSQHENENIRKIATYISLEYGLQYGSILSYIALEFSQFITNNILIGFNIEIPDGIESYLSKILLDEVYSEKLIRNKVNQHFNQNYTFIPNYILVRVGYKVENNIIYKSGLGNISNAIKKYIMKKGYYDKNDFTIPINSSVEQVIRMLEVSHDMIKVDKGKLESIEYFNNQGLTKQLIKSFLSQIKLIGGTYKIFTLYYLIRYGFDHEILHLGLSDYILNRIITTIPGVQFCTMKNYVFSFKNINFASENILSSISKKYKTSDILDLKEILITEYNIDLPMYKIRYLLEKIEKLHLKNSDRSRV